MSGQIERWNEKVKTLPPSARSAGRRTRKLPIPVCSRYAALLSPVDYPESRPQTPDSTMDTSLIQGRSYWRQVSVGSRTGLRRTVSLCPSARYGVAVATPPASSSSHSKGPAGNDANLLRIHNSTLGLSAPSLTQVGREVSVPRRAGAGSSFIKGTSPVLPRCHSPLSSIGSPLESPRTMSPSQHQQFVPFRRAECRRWSVASLPSSGYGTTPASSNVSSQYSSQERLHQLPTTPTAEDMQILCRHFSSSESNPAVDDDGGQRSCGSRQRSRSLNSSPVRSAYVDSDVVEVNALYKERFPKATQQMEQRLENFISEYSTSDSDPGWENISAAAVAIVRFVQHQLVELARDCLSKSREDLISTRYFYQMTDNLELLINEAKEKSIETVPHLSRIARKLLLVISRPARLLECLQFDPEEFYHMLEEAEGQCKVSPNVKDIPRYIVTQLGLNRDVLEQFQEDLTLLEKSCSSAKPHGDSSTTPTGQELPNENDYEIMKLISNGAYGAVYLVRHRQTRQRFALKKINKRNLVLRNQIGQAFAERDILCFTDNPFVVSLYCSFETKRHLCLVMEYVEGGDCATLLKNMGPFPCDMARFYFAETVLAVEYLHSFGIVHRDLKPDNLLITAMGHIKLTDFGLSKMGLMSLATNLYEGYIDRETREFSDKQVFGTPEYIAPEVLLRRGYGKPVDWWSMGIILYEFLIGCVPFFGETPEELFSHVINDDIEWPDEDDWPIQTEARELITALLRQNPRDRLGAAGAAEVKLHSFFSGLDWNSLLRQKVDFVPQLEGDDDTSYFDTRTDRYCHDDTDDTHETLTFKSFSSCSPRYKVCHSEAKPCADAENPTSGQDRNASAKADVSPRSTPESRRRLYSISANTSPNQKTKHRPLRRSLTTVSLVISPGDLVNQESAPCPPASCRPSVILQRGPNGFGFTVKSIRVYVGDSDLYTLQHVVLAVDEKSAAYEAGIRPADLITHINEEAVQGLFHTQVLELLLSGGSQVTLRTIPLDQTTIRRGGRRREPAKSRLARRASKMIHGAYCRRQPANHKGKGEQCSRRKISLLRRLSSKRANAEIQQHSSSGSSFPNHADVRYVPGSSSSRAFLHDSVIRAAEATRGSSDSLLSSSPSSVSSSDCSSGSGQFSRPSSLQFLQGKLQSPKKQHSLCRRRSIGQIPLSPLARTPSPSSFCQVNPVLRLGNPLNVSSGHLPGVSQTTQSFSPGSSSSSLSPMAKSCFSTRPRSAEPGSPLLRRALSPDLHRYPKGSSCDRNPGSSSLSNTQKPSD